ncbi:hypothetical protein JIN85_13980 [Luteolibacter pohnpeiensis]|uniref:Uncharacterized protein n=1 Tax=Luteolibacter pohnpeiensis TaxID=454153 RepID=A0A934S8Y6_9BACT|nr:hypothetical protein [Luteolibacter pohnpeiensis]MBK1883530.1 hypothetical protein [Luteolibacter pohnpeiensis]
MEPTETNYTGPDHSTATLDPANHEIDAKDRQHHMEKKIVSSLRDGIDMRGRYKYQLKDFSIGYAAGKGISEQAARDQIGQLFERDMGISLHGYLEQHRLDRGLEVGKDQNRGGR